MDLNAYKKQDLVNRTTNAMIQYTREKHILAMRVNFTILSLNGVRLRVEVIRFSMTNINTIY